MLWAFYLATMSHGRGVEEYSLYSGIALQTLTYFHLIQFYFRWPGDGERGKTNLRWITRNWAVAFATIMTKISSTRRRVSATCIASSVTCRACWDTPLRSCTPCWMWSQMLTSDGHRRDWGHPAETFKKKTATALAGLLIFRCYSMFYFPELIFHIQGWELRELQLYSIGRGWGWREEVKTSGVGGSRSSWADFPGERKRSSQKCDGPGLQEEETNVSVQSLKQV